VTREEVYSPLNVVRANRATQPELSICANEALLVLVGAFALSEHARLAKVCQQRAAVVYEEIVCTNVAVSNASVVKVIQRVGRLANVCYQFGRRKNGLVLSTLRPLAEAAFREIHKHYKLVFEQPISMEFEYERMLQRTQQAEPPHVANPFL
jgi:hypothetical protein